MALASAPSTPDRAVPPPFIRRSFTAPIKSSRSAVPISEETVQGAEALYAHNGCKIVSFNTSSSLIRRHSSVSDGRSDFQDEPVGMLPWASTTERTIAAGPLRIYKVLGTAFLNSGDTLHPILPKSQCWCVDGESKFVLRIRPKTYYRIELPTQTSEDKEKVEKMKDVLAKVLQYEVTPCPFKRGFYVELPEPPKTPIIKRPWRPKPRAETTSYMSEELEGIDELMLEDDSKSSISANAEAGPGGPLLKTDGRDQKSYAIPHSDGSSTVSTEIDHDSEAADDTGLTRNHLQDNALVEMGDFKTSMRPKHLRTGRTVTAPPQLTLRTTAPSNSLANALPIPKLRQESSSLASSLDSFHSFHSPISPLPLSPTSFARPSLPLEAEVAIEVSRSPSHKRDVSEITVRASSPELWELSSGHSGEEATYQSPSDFANTPTLVSEVASVDDDCWSEAITPSPPTEMRHYTIRPRRRTHSPMPSNSNLYAPYSPRSHISGHHLTTAILQRTCSLLLGPPVQLVALMLRIAAKIARGAFRGSAYGFGQAGHKIPCSWDFSDGSDENDDIWEVDDYGFSLSKAPSVNSNSEEKEGGNSWEID